MYHRNQIDNCVNWYCFEHNIRIESKTHPYSDEYPPERLSVSLKQYDFLCVERQLNKTSRARTDSHLKTKDKTRVFVRPSLIFYSHGLTDRNK